MRRLEDALEWLDRPVPPAEREATLGEIARLNAWFGGDWLTWRAIDRLAARVPAEEPILVIDVGGGRGDFARRLRAWARRRRRVVRVVVVDRDPAGFADVARVCADVAALPFREGVAHVAAASLTLHHLKPEAVVRCLEEMRAAARLGIVVNDLLRTGLALALVWLATRLVTRHPFTRDDGPLSVRRAYAPAELRALAEKAGVRRLEIRRYPLLSRVVAVGT